MIPPIQRLKPAKPCTFNIINIPLCTSLWNGSTCSVQVHTRYAHDVFQELYKYKLLGFKRQLTATSAGPRKTSTFPGDNLLLIADRRVLFFCEVCGRTRLRSAFSPGTVSCTRFSEKVDKHAGLTFHLDRVSLFADRRKV